MFMKLCFRPHDPAPGRVLNELQLRKPTFRPTFWKVGSCKRESSIEPEEEWFSASPHLLLETFRLLVIENDPETPLARMLTRFLSASLSTIPSKVTLPFLTIIRIGLMTGKA